MLITQQAKGLQGFGLSGPRVPDNQHGGLAGLLQDHADQRAVERQPAALHHADIMERQHHLFQVPEISVFIPAGGGGDKQIVFTVVVKDRGKFRQTVERTVRCPEGIDGIGFAVKVVAAGQLEQVA